MEYKKNRQKVIIKTLGKGGWTFIENKHLLHPLPSFLNESKQSGAIAKSLKSVSQQLYALKDRAKRILKNPSRSDELYKSLHRIFKKDKELHLGRKNSLRFEIRELAWKRFKLGYPPKKDDDLSMGDAINWEWIVHCAKNEKKNVIIVTRDTDYGHCYDNEHMINDWLQEEFKARVKGGLKVELTNSVASAFKKANIKITKKEINAEERLIETYDN